MKPPAISKTRLLEVKDLFDAADPASIRFWPVLDNAWVELGMELSFDPLRLTSIPKQRARALLRAIDRFLARQNDLLLRRYFIGWLREELTRDPERHRELWRLYARLVVKDFHGDLASLMDSTAPIIILMETDLVADQRWATPSFADLQPTSPSPYKTLTPELRAVVDDTLGWWPFVKELRHVVYHRDHNRFVFGAPEDGFLVQIEDAQHRPLLIDPVFAAPIGTQLADFHLYSTWAFAEVLHYLHHLGLALYNRLQLPRDRFSTSAPRRDATELLATLETLISRA